MFESLFHQPCRQRRLPSPPSTVVILASRYPRRKWNNSSPPWNSVALTRPIATQLSSLRLLAGSIAPLQHHQNAAARLVMGLRARDHVTSTLADLHWVPVCFHTDFKVSLTIFQIHSHHPVSRIPQQYFHSSYEPTLTSMYSFINRR